MPHAEKSQPFGEGYVYTLVLKFWKNFPLKGEFSLFEGNDIRVMQLTPALGPQFPSLLYVEVFLARHSHSWGAFFPRPLNAEAGLLSGTQSFAVDGLVFGLFVDRFVLGDQRVSFVVGLFWEKCYFYLPAVLFHESRLSSREVAFDYERYFVTRRSRGEEPLCWEGLYFSVRFPLASGFLFVELLVLEERCLSAYEYLFC